MCEQLKQLRLDSGRLFAKSYVLLEGLSASRHKLASKFADDHQELVARLERKFPKHPRDINWDKADKYAGTTIVRHCHDIVQSLKPAYTFFEDLSAFTTHVLEWLGRIHQSLGPISFKDGPNALVSQWMALFCDILALHLVVQKTPKEKIIQIYVAAYYAQNRQDPPHLANICHMLVRLAEAPVQQFQKDMLQFEGRIRQVQQLQLLEYIACPLLTRFGSVLAICQSGMFSLNPSLQERIHVLDLNLDIPPGTVLKYLMDYKTLERWVLFGTLMCPGVCDSVEIRSCLHTVLSKSHHLEIYRDLHEPVHALFRDNIYAKLTELYNEEKARLLRTASTASRDIDAELFKSTSTITSTCQTWREISSEMLSSSKCSLAIQKSATRRSFTWKHAKAEKASLRSCRSFAGVVSGSFSIPDRSVPRSVEEQDEQSCAQYSVKSTENAENSTDDFKTKKAKAKAEIRELITAAEEIASATAQKLHAAGCCALVHVMENILDAAKVDPGIVVQELDVVLTVLSLAKCEIMWDVVRRSQLVMPSKKRDGLPFKERPYEMYRSRKGEEAERPLVIGPLMELTVKVQALLLKYRTCICHYKLDAHKGQYLTMSDRMTAVLRRLEGQVEVPAALMGHLELMEEWMHDLYFPCEMSQEDDASELTRPSLTPRLRAGEAFWVWEHLGEFKDAWLAAESILSDVESTLNIGTMINIGCDEVLFDLKQVVLDVAELGNFVETIANLSSLKDLAFYEPQIHDLIRQNLRETATPETSFNVLFLLHIFSEFHKNTIWADDPFNRATENGFIDLAERCAIMLCSELEDFIRDLFMKSTMHTSPNHLPVKSPQTFDLLVYWFSVIGSFGCVEVIPGFLFNAADFLNSIIVVVLRDTFQELGLREEGVHGFKQMKATYSHLIFLLAEFEGLVDFEILPSVHTAILGLIKPENQDVSVSQCPALDSMTSDGDLTPYFRDLSVLNEQCLVSLIGDTMATRIVRDPRNMGIIFDPRKRRFIKKETDARPEKWVGVGCSVEDLRCLLSVFGILGVQQLEAQFRCLISQSFAKLDAYLNEHEDMLKSITLAFSQEKELIDSTALHHLASKLTNLSALGDITLQFSRSLIIRQLLSDAYYLQIQSSGDPACMSAQQLGLPQPTSAIQNYPSSSEPVMVEFFHNLLHSDELDRWMYVPALFSCLAHEMIPNAKSFHAENGYFSNGMHQIVYTLNSIALTLETVFQDIDVDTESVEPSCESFNLLFAKCLAMFTFHSKEKQSTISDTCLLLYSVCGNHLSLEQLEDIGLMSTRVKSAEISAQKRHVTC